MDERKPKMQKTLMLTDKGYKDLKKAVAACTVTNFSMFIPSMIMLLVIMEMCIRDRPGLGDAGDRLYGTK